MIVLLILVQNCKPRVLVYYTKNTSRSPSLVNPFFLEVDIR